MQEMRLSKELPSTLVRAVADASRLVGKLSMMASWSRPWIVSVLPGGWRFAPLWPTDYSSYLHEGVPKVLLMSALMSEKTAGLLGVPESDSEWVISPSYFPPGNTPVIYISSPRVDHKAQEPDMRMWVYVIDQIIDRRLDRKGILFPVSYERRNLFLAQTRHRDICFAHSRDDLEEVVARFKAAQPPALLVSPSVTSGYSFDSSLCEYIVIGKVPWPDSRDPVVSARKEVDPEWAPFQAMETIVQQAGRGTRSPNDRCEILITDDNWRWFWPKYRHFSPEWFQHRVLSFRRDIPHPPPKLV